MDALTLKYRRQLQKTFNLLQKAKRDLRELPNIQHIMRILIWNRCSGPIATIPSGFKRKKTTDNSSTGQESSGTAETDCGR